jgi:hypothetical protein
MNEPKRWVDQGAPPDIEQLVRAGQAEHPDGESLKRTLAAVGVGLGTTSVAAGVKAAGKAASVGGTAQATASSTGILLAKWTVLGATAGGLAVGAATIATNATPAVQGPASSAPISARARAGSTRGAVQPDARGTAPVANAPREATPVAPTLDAPREAPTALGPANALRPPVEGAPASAVPLDADTLAEEVKSIDRARAALASGQAAQTLVVLDDYDRRFSKRGFAPEALRLRMEAYTSLGRTAEARAAAERLLASYPNSLHGARARAVLSKNP